MAKYEFYCDSNPRKFKACAPDRLKLTALAVAALDANTLFKFSERYAIPQTKQKTVATSRTTVNPVKNPSICFLKKISMAK